jgi:hypothetical protein
MRSSGSKTVTSLGIATLILLIFSATASAASFHLSEAPSSIQGSNSSSAKEFVIEGASFACESETLEHPLFGAETAETLELTMSYQACSGFGFALAHVEDQFCEWELSANASTIDLLGCAGWWEYNEIEYGYGMTLKVSTIFETNCIVFIPNQEGINGVAYENDYPWKEELAMSTESTNLSYSVVESTGFCPLAKGSGSDGELIGTTSLTADLGSTDIWRE